MNNNLSKYNNQKKNEASTIETPFDQKKVAKKNYKILKIDSTLHSSLKLEAVKRNTTMQDLTEKALMEYLNK